MANTATKIEKWGLAPEVLEILRDGIVSPTAISERLNSFMQGKSEHEGRKVSRNAVKNFLENHKSEIGKVSAQIFEDHAQRVMPQHLDRLEEYACACHGWFLENAENRHARLAEAAIKIKSEKSKWKAILAGLDDPKKEDDSIRAIISRCLKIVAGDDDEKKLKLAIIRQGLAVTELMVTKSAMLNDEGTGGIFLLDDRAEFERLREQAGKCAGRVPFRMVVGGSGNGS